MGSSEIKIFYSWQSDLPGSQTRYLIQDSVDAAVKAMRNTIEIIADRDTMGEFGTPDITQTIFSKIDECDIFVADVSIINKYYSIDENGDPTDEMKTSPNPNVLLELGYAARSLGWENVICILNTDFGEIEELPFDIRQRRLTPYSLKNEEKSVVKKRLREIIAATVMNIQENGKRVKDGLTNLIVGAYDFEMKSLSKQLMPLELKNSKGYKEERKRLLSICENLIEEIEKINLAPPEELQSEPQAVEINEEKQITLPNGVKLTKFNNELIKAFGSPAPVVVEDESKERMISNAKDWFDIALGNDFFYLGELKLKAAFLHGQSEEYIGTKDEKNKHEKVSELDYTMLKISIIDSYVQTFEGMHLIPLAIYNSSAQADRDITVSIQVNNDSAEIMVPSSELINKDLIGLQGIIYETGFIKEILIMPETSDIKYDSDITYDLNESLSHMQKTTISMMGSTSPNYDSEDYEREIQKFIASPINSSRNEVEFDIDDLSPKEKKWLGPSLLVKAKTNKISLTYSVKSQHSSGDLSGVIECDLD